VSAAKNFILLSSSEVISKALGFLTTVIIARRVGVNGLFASHIGIFGNTGSGKSYTLAKIYRELFLKYKDKRKFKKNYELLIKIKN